VQTEQVEIVAKSIHLKINHTYKKTGKCHTGIKSRQKSPPKEEE